MWRCRACWGHASLADLRRTDVDGEVVITVGAQVVYRYVATDAGMRNMAAVTLSELGFTGRAVSEVLGITEEYVSMLRARVRREGSGALMRRQGRPPALGQRELATARAMRADGGPTGKRLLPLGGLTSC